MPLTYTYTREYVGMTSSNATMYGIVTTIPAAFKKAGVTISGTISSSTSNSAVGWRVAVEGTLRYKVNGGTQQDLKYITDSKTGGSLNVSGTFSITLDMTNVTKIGFNYAAAITKAHTGSSGPSSFSPSFTHRMVINFSLPSDIATETIITANKVNEIAGVVGANTSASVGSVIKVAQYNALATAVGSSAFDSTKPLAANMTTLLSAVNSASIAKSWDSTDAGDY